MAELMCPGCKADMPAGTQYCQSCFLTPVTKPSVAENACGDPDCPTGGQPPAAGCRPCGLSGASAPTLSFAWGTVAVPADQPLVVGRENSPIASQLGDYSNISRRHAEVRSDGRALTVVDLDSMNGTFVNDQRLAPNQETPVRAGDKIRFAARLEATVTGEAS